MKVMIGFAVALCALALLLIKQLFEKQAQLDAVRAQLQQAHERLGEWERFRQATERSAAWGPSGRADEWGGEARRLSDLADLEQAPERLADLQQRVRHLRAAFPPAPTVPGS
jgi:uncharacterized protein (DUF3084 family)